MDYRIGDVIVCKKGVACAYGVSVGELERAFKSCKRTDLGRVYSEGKIRKWGDGTVHHMFTHTRTIKWRRYFQVTGTLLENIDVPMFLGIFSAPLKQCVTGVKQHEAFVP